MCNMKKSLWLIPLAMFLALCALVIYGESTASPTTVTTLVTITTETDTTTATSMESTTAATETTAFVVDYNLNTAQEEDLITVDGVGEVLAKRILAQRTQLNGFSSREELLAVNGIGDVLLERIMEQFYIENEVVSTTASSLDTTTAQIVNTATAQTTVETAETVPPERFELNAVTADELCTVPGIDAAFAEEIIAFRTEIGGFSHPYELCLVGNKSTDWWSKRIDRFYVEGCTDPVVNPPQTQE